MKSYLAILLLALVPSPFTVCVHENGNNVAQTESSGNESAAIATFTGGCFWCVESAFEGVFEAGLGYTGGETANLTYNEVSASCSGHVEAVQICYDPQKFTYEKLRQIFWRQIDPTDAGGQFADRGPQYKATIYVHAAEQRSLAENSRAELARSGRFDKPIVTESMAAGLFYRVEKYHQDYHLKPPAKYKRCRHGSGRTPFLKTV